MVIERVRVFVPGEQDFVVSMKLHSQDVSYRVVLSLYRECPCVGKFRVSLERDPATARWYGQRFVSPRLLAFRGTLHALLDAIWYDELLVAVRCVHNCCSKFLPSADLTPWDTCTPGNIQGRVSSLPPLPSIDTSSENPGRFLGNSEAKGEAIDMRYRWMGRSSGLPLDEESIQVASRRLPLRKREAGGSRSIENTAIRLDYTSRNLGRKEASPQGVTDRAQGQLVRPKGSERGLHEGVACCWSGRGLSFDQSTSFSEAGVAWILKDRHELSHSEDRRQASLPGRHVEDIRNTIGSSRTYRRERSCFR